MAVPLTELNESLVALYGRMRILYEDTVVAMGKTGDAARALEPDTIVDAVYVLKRQRELADALRKEIDKYLETLQKCGCLIAMQTEDNRLTGQIAMGHGDATQQPLLPDRAKDPVAYSKLMQAIGVPEAVADNPAVKPSWDGCRQLVERLNSEGKPLPEGLESLRTVPKFTIAARMLKGMDIDGLANEVLGIGVYGASPASSTDDVPF